MPRVTISINAPNEASDSDLLTLDLPPGLTVKDLKGFVEAETNFPAPSQHFFLNGRPLTNEVQTLEEAGIKDGEMLAVLIRQRGGAAQGQQGRAGPASGRNQSDHQQDSRRRGAPDPESVRLHILGDPAAQEQLRQRKPELLAALGDPAQWREAYNREQRQEEDAERERQNQIALLNEDPFNIDAQRKIEEIIRQDRVIENLQHTAACKRIDKSHQTSRGSTNPPSSTTKNYGHPPTTLHRLGETGRSTSRTIGP
ncbi:hypothetical protein BCR34DRAFT_156865 [Clohesyomyces aquaticus]|uniref:Ubiquitin-like domain-containing protein n=1 Tax=Clohesyomyces aquaticus TaxID=1231657 RepID=A0A1Y1YJA6_9PLEO|nr:hypothetical protein BCR34DRAFT_156865 [Clohesyomyces aquaticus]